VHFIKNHSLYNIFKHFIIYIDNNVPLFWHYHIRHNVIEYNVLKHWRIHAIIKINITLEQIIINIFTWVQIHVHLDNKDLKGTPSKITQHWIKFDTLILLIYQTWYKLNMNYVAIIKHNIDKILIKVARFIQLINKATWLSSFVVIPQKIRIYGFVNISKSLML
jgi:hypothetical protein